MLKNLIITAGVFACLCLTCCDAATKNVDHCGDGFTDTGEECDGADLGEQTCESLGHYLTTGTLLCRPDCTWDRTGCGGRCGDNTVDTEDGETCDGNNLGEASCQSLGYGGGTLLCGMDCRFDATGCTTSCGNGLVEGDETCDDGNPDPEDGCASDCTVEAGWTCADGNPSVCTTTCGDDEAFGDEACDGADLRAGSCADGGYYGGQLACTPSCTLDWSDCETAGRCGDGAIQGASGEQCDGLALGGQTCEDLGFYEGTLACDQATCRHDTDGCTGRCGDLLIQASHGEVCDSDLLDGVTCLTLGWHGGELDCGADCLAFDEAACAAVGRCGDDVIQSGYGELCDGAALGGQTCVGLGYDRGTLDCRGDCLFDTTGCLGPFTAVTGGIVHTCALKRDGSAWCWGFNGSGQLGDGTTTNRAVPAAVSGLGAGVTSLHAGGLFTCALRNDGSVLCWGENILGQLGDGTTTNRAVPTAVSGLSSGVTSLSAGKEHACIVKSNGSAWCWGRNLRGQLGDNSTTDRTVPTAVSGLGSGVASIHGGEEHTCVVKTNGSAWCWGLNSMGQVGDGTTTNRLVPTAVSTLSTGVSSLHAGYIHTCARKSDGAVWCWGGNTEGQLGDGTTTSRLSPTAVVGLSSGVSALVGDTYHNCVVKTGGTVWCWGWNVSGQLGDGTTTNRLSPILVSSLPFGGIALGCGQRHTCAVLADESLWCWGSNTSRQLGDGTTTDRLTPVPVDY